MVRLGTQTKATRVRGITIKQCVLSAYPAAELTFTHLSYKQLGSISFATFASRRMGL